MEPSVPLTSTTASHKLRPGEGTTLYAPARPLDAAQDSVNSHQGRKPTAVPDSSRPHTLLQPVYHPAQPSVLYFDASRSHRGAFVIFNNGGQLDPRPIPQGELSSAAFTSKSNNIRLFLDIPHLPRWVHVWVDISSPGAITVGEILAQVYYKLRASIASEDWRALQLSPGLPQIQDALRQRHMRPKATEQLSTSGDGSNGVAGVRWIDALGGRNYLQGLTRAEWHRTSNAEYHNAPPVQESWVAHFGYNPFASS